MQKGITYFFIFLSFLVLVKMISNFMNVGDGRSLYAWGLIILSLTIIAVVIREKVRRKNEGYYVRTHGGAEDGYVLYNEGGKTLKLYFSRSKDTIYVPSDLKWKEIMPSWARERKLEIIGRIKKHVGKRLIGQGWSYEESDREETLLTQNGYD